MASDAGGGRVRAIWLEPAPWHVVVAIDDDHVVGTAKCGPNRPGRGSHVATASFMVDPARQGEGIGRALAEHVLAWAKDAGYHGMQFNAVVETDAGALRLWQALGFASIGWYPNPSSIRRRVWSG